jgi:uncharacterized membrane protein YkvA (DUF1232 family)
VEWWEIVLAVILVGLLVSVVGLMMLWRLASGRTKRLALRVGRLPLSAKLELARTLVADPSIPLPVRLILPALVVYLSLPIDVVPDFIPVLGQVDDLLMTGVGMALLVRFTPIRALEGHLAALELRYGSSPSAGAR